MKFLFQLFFFENHSIMSPIDKHMLLMDFSFQVLFIKCSLFVDNIVEMVYVILTFVSVGQ